MPRQWFVGRTKQGKEALARAQLENQGYETYLPMYISEWARYPRTKPFLQGYIFVGFDPKIKPFTPIYSTIGMANNPTLITSGEYPQAISPRIVEAIKEREGPDGLVRLPAKAISRFQRGERVRIRGNPIEALFHEVVDLRRAVVFLNLLGRHHELIVPISKLTTAPVVSAVA